MTNLLLLLLIDATTSKPKMHSKKALKHPRITNLKQFKQETTGFEKKMKTNNNESHENKMGVTYMYGQLRGIS